MLPIILTTLSALRLPSEGLLARRAVLINAASAAALIGSRPLAASADEASEFLAGVAKAQEQNLGPSVFEGTYTDPFHPGGKRIITLTDTKLGGFQLAKVNGGGGQGEPASFELPAMVSKAPGKQDAQHGQALSIAAPQLGSRACPRRRWRLWAARHSQEGRAPERRAAASGARASRLQGRRLHCCLRPSRTRGRSRSTSALRAGRRISPATGTQTASSSPPRLPSAWRTAGLRSADRRTKVTAGQPCAASPLIRLRNCLGGMDRRCGAAVDTTIKTQITHTRSSTVKKPRVQYQMNHVSSHQLSVYTSSYLRFPSSHWASSCTLHTYTSYARTSIYAP